MFEDDTVLVARARQIPLQQVRTSWLTAAGIQLVVRRDDLVDAAQSGNKYYKLFFNLQQAQLTGSRRIISFGGAWSNHLYALAAAATEAGLEVQAIVRGEMPARLSACLQDVQRWGGGLTFVSRTAYGRKHLPEQLAQWVGQGGTTLVVPEGGANLAGAAGMRCLGRALEEQLEGRPAQICLAAGTGTSLAGVAAGVSGRRPVLGFPVLRAGLREELPLASRVHELVTQLGAKSANWRLLWGFHGGGYGRKPKAALWHFWQDFEAETGLLLDPVYTLKLFWGIYSLVQLGYWPRGTCLVAIHTGGFQGRRGFDCP